MAVPSHIPHNGMPQPGPRMANYFWSNDNTALNTILDRLQKSKRTCETILKLFEKRAQIEQEYGERLLKLSQIHLSDSEEPMSTFSELLESVPIATEAAARAHIDLSQQIHHLLEVPLANFIKEQKAARKMSMAEIDQMQNLRYMHLDNVKRARNAYLTECANLEEVQKYASNPEAEEVVQMKQKVATVDQEYKLSLGILESVTASWTDEWRKSCNVFQELEERKLNYLGGTLHAYANMISNVYTIDDQSSDRIRAAYDNLDIPSDMNQFIRAKGTGTAIPEGPKYTSYENTEEKPKPTIKIIPRTIREINIPVVDEELRSVNDQLRKLPSMRAQERPPVKTRTPASPIKESPSVSPVEPPSDSKEPSTLLSYSFDEKHEEEQSPMDQVAPEPKSSEKALPSLPGDKVITTDNKSSFRQLSEPVQYDASNNNTDDILRQTATSLTQSSPSFLPSDPHQPQYYHYNSNNISSPHLPTTVVTRSTTIREDHGHNRMSINTKLSPMDFDEQEATRKGKKKNKTYSAVFPFLKKKTDSHQGAATTASTEEKTSTTTPRFSLGVLRGTKKEHKSPMASQQTSPHSPNFPSSGQHTPSPVENTGNGGGWFPGPPLPAQGGGRLEDEIPIMEYVRAQWSYDAKIESEITFTKNDVLAVFEKKRDGWWDAQIIESSNDHNINSRGLVPGNFMASL